MASGNSYIPLSDIIADAAEEMQDMDFGKKGKPFYISAAQRGLSLMMKEVMGDQRTWSAEVPENFILTLPGGLEEIDAAYVYLGNICDITSADKLYIKPGLHRLGGSSYFANIREGSNDPLQRQPWYGDVPSCVYYAGRFQNELHLSDSCAGKRVHLLYQGLGMEEFGDDFKVPYWMREALTDFVVMRAAMALRRSDPQYLTQIVREKKEEMERGSWLKAKSMFKRMDRKTREDTRLYLESYGGRN